MMRTMASRNKLIVGNWKMNPDYLPAMTLIDALSQEITTDYKYCSEIVVCPPFPYLSIFQKKLSQIKGNCLQLGGQDVHWETNGAWTSKISASMLASLAVRYVILGHSELRIHFSESNQMINKKIRAVCQENMIPILCVGESLADRERQQEKEFVQQQLEQSLTGLSTDEIKALIIAYEPIWAIGTGNTASAAQADEMHAFIRQYMISSFPNIKEISSIRILYGGSLNAKNASSLLAKENIDGGLIGGASLSAPDFIEIIKQAESLQISK